MQCNVRLFAQARTLAGVSETVLELPAGATVSDALETLLRTYGELEPLRSRLAVAVDERYARSDLVLHDGCTIALIPPVSGG